MGVGIIDIEQSAFVLHSRPYRETSVLVTFFSPEYGKFNGVVKGVRGGRKTSTQKSAILQPFQLLTIQWREKNHKASDLVSINQFEMANLRFPLAGDANICGLYLNELLYRLLFPLVAIEPLFGFYQQALYQLLSAQNRSEQAWALRQFEFHLLNELGQGLVCDMDINQTAIDETAHYYFYPESGAIRVEMDGLATGIPISGRSLMSLSSLEYDEVCLPELKKLFRTILNQYLGDKPIMTRQLFN